MPESAYGPTNNCVGIGHRLLQRGHRVVFVVDPTWRARLEPLGFAEEIVNFAPLEVDGAGASPGQFWKEYIASVSPHFATSTTEQLTSVIRPIWRELIDGAYYVQDQLREIVSRVAPDVIVEDNVLGFPALVSAGKPFVRIVSCNPLEVPGADIAPAFSGLGQSERGQFDAFRRAYRETHGPLWEEFRDWFFAEGGVLLPELEFIPPGDLNLYVYPEELDYRPSRPLDATWHRLESCVRDTDPAVALPDGFADGRRPVLYFSLGSLGSADVALVRRVIDALANEPYDVIVSKGPRHDEIELADNMWGAEFLPQTRLLERADLVITHGGNNTVTECLHFAKPMVVMPLFWDQYDNAQRVHECGYGRRLSTYEFTPDELRHAVNDLISEAALRRRLEVAGRRIRRADGVGRAATLIEALAGENS